MNTGIRQWTINWYTSTMIINKALKVFEPTNKNKNFGYQCNLVFNILTLLRLNISRCIWKVCKLGYLSKLKHIKYLDIFYSRIALRSQIKLINALSQIERGQWAVYYTSVQSFTITLSYSLTQQLWGLRWIQLSVQTFHH